ncbi:MAG: ABC transporter ATP-binding protein [Planctomycetes bacterium]|nr:ABC transporter ATP-binding protein [Planctomycetota bacterium]
MIRLQKLTKRFGTFEAVRGIDLDIPAGQLVGLLGPNGAGKSTTLKMLTGTLVPTSGIAEIDGIDVVKDPVAVKRILGYVPETGAVFEALTGREYLELVAALHGIPEREVDERIERFLAFFDLSAADTRSAPLATFSKGMRQKIVITAALLHNPRVVFFDEPLNGLDANAALLFKTLVTSLAKEGKTVVWCSHILDVVERICERVVIIHQGRVIEDGAVPAILERTRATSLEQAFNQLTSTQNLTQRAEDMARSMTK